MENFSLNQEEFENYLLSKNQTNLVDYIRTEKDSEGKKIFMKVLKEIDYDLLNRLFKSYLEKENKKVSEKLKEENDLKMIEPLKFQFSKQDFNQEESVNILDIGYEKIATGKVALLILAGGQGSRLGFPKAKGLYNIQMPSNKTLFEYLTNRFLSIQNLAKQKIIENNETSDCVFLVMTSKENDSDIISFFNENNLFGLKKENVIFFAQDTLPAIDLQGNIILKNKFEIFEAPNGNGGCFMALKNEKIIELLVERKVEFLNVISIDNTLAKPLDPFFVGITYAKNQKMSAKTIPKTDPKEPVGVFVKMNNRPMMIDYAELDENLSNLRDKDCPEKLVFRASNILNYLISVDMLQKILNENYQDLINDFHIAKKNISCYQFKKEGDTISESLSTTPGLKFELFFNSVFLFANDLLLFEVNRLEEFAPVKNNDQAATDNPKITKELMSRLFKKWLINSGKNFKDNENQNGLLEISFLKSFDGENLNTEEIRDIEIDLSKGSFYIN